MENLTFREFNKSDANEIIKWITCEREFYFWSADRYGHYPIKPEEITENYSRCEKQTYFKPMIMEAAGKPVGHLILRTPTADKRVIRLGFIIVDGDMRGKGYGKKLVKFGLDYAENLLNATEINLGVFENNTEAIACYKTMGFDFEDDENSDEIHTFAYKNEVWNYKTMKYKGI